MTVSARALFHHARNSFVPPADWVPQRWRRSPILACGLTALAVEAALRDLGEERPVVLRDPTNLRAYLKGERGLVGCSFSGRSSEVSTGLSLATRLGLATCRIGSAVTAGSDPPDIALPEPAPPAHLGHIAFAAVLPPLFEGAVNLSATAPPPDRALLSCLAETFQREMIPVFVGAGHGLRARLLCAYWLESLGRPAFSVRFPDWTHDLLWALERSRDARIALFIEAPKDDLPDGRFEQMRTWLASRDFLYHPLEPLPEDRDGAVETLIAMTDLFGGLARDLGLAPPSELIFDSTGEVVTR